MASNLQLDKWQEDVLNTSGNIVLRSGRQVGKSTIISIKAAEYAVSNPKKSIMIISAVERQAYLLFSKVLAYIHDNHRKQIKTGRDRPTKSELKLKNGSIIRCLPTGLDGLGIRGYTVDLLIADEAAFIPQAVWPALTPMLATTGGTMIFLSTPFGRRGYFYECFFDDRFTKFHINAEDVANSRSEPQRSNMLAHQEAEKKRMTKMQYAQEYLGEFVDELRQFFSDDMIKMCCVLQRRAHTGGKAYLGCDIARMGDDQTTFEIIEKLNKDYMEQIESIVTTKTLTTETFDRIVELERSYKFKQIGIDAGSGSLGVGILDFLLRNSSTRNKVIALNNRKRSLDFDGENRTRLQKEDMYQCVLSLMQSGKIKLLDDDDLKASLRSVQYEIVIEPGKPTKVKMFGNDTHIAEGIIRAVWLANEDKSLNLWASSSSNARIR